MIRPPCPGRPLKTEYAEVCEIAFADDLSMWVTNLFFCRSTDFNDLQANDDDFATMNFIIAGLSMTIFFNTLAVYLKIRKINRENEIEVSPEEAQKADDSETAEL